MFIRGHPGTPIDSAPVLLSGIHSSTSHFMFQVACARWKCNAEGDFSRSRVKFNDPLGSGLVDVGPCYALFFYLLRDAPVDAYMHGLPVSHGWFIGAEH